MKIGLLSDTHGFLDDVLFRHFQDCDEIWHAGDIGNRALSDSLSNFKKLRAVYGNIDGTEIRKIHPLHQKFNCEGINVWITHIGGYPKHYPPGIKSVLKTEKIDLFICGHSHILKIMRDPDYGSLLHMNPGAAGLEGFHKVRTAIRFDINSGKMSNVEVIELGKRG